VEAYAWPKKKGMEIFEWIMELDNSFVVLFYYNILINSNI
jgi:hypothetical protein